MNQKSTGVPNADLVITSLHLIESYDIGWIKVKAHQRENSEHTTRNRFVDKLSRMLVRGFIADKLLLLCIAKNYITQLRHNYKRRKKNKPVIA